MTDLKTGECSSQEGDQWPGGPEQSLWLTPWLGWPGRLTSNSLTMLGWSSFFITAISRTISLGRLGLLEACSHTSRGRRSQEVAARSQVTVALWGQGSLQHRKPHRGQQPCTQASGWGPQHTCCTSHPAPGAYMAQATATGPALTAKLTMTGLDMVLPCSICRAPEGGPPPDMPPGLLPKFEAELSASWLATGENPTPVRAAKGDGMIGGRGSPLCSFWAGLGSCIGSAAAGTSPRPPAASWLKAPAACSPSSVASTAVALPRLDTVARLVAGLDWPRLTAGLVPSCMRAPREGARLGERGVPSLGREPKGVRPAAAAAGPPGPAPGMGMGELEPAVVSLRRRLLPKRDSEGCVPKISVATATPASGCCGGEVNPRLLAAAGASPKAGLSASDDANACSACCVLTILQGQHLGLGSWIMSSTDAAC